MSSRRYYRLDLQDVRRDGGALSRGARRDRARERAFIRRIFPAQWHERAMREWHYGVTKQLALVMAAHGHQRVNGLPASQRTHAYRGEVLFLALKQLRGELGHRLDTLRQIRERHWIDLVRLWDSQGLAASTINTRLSVVRVLGGWLGRPGLVPPVTELVKFGFGPGVARRRSYAVNDYTWGDPAEREAIYRRVEAYDLRYGLILRLQGAFGLRRKEAVMLRPGTADRGDQLGVFRGAKNGRKRWVPIRTAEQRELLDRCRRVIPPGDSMSGRERPLGSALSRVSRIAPKFGITKANGKTQHGQRQGYINDRLEEELGVVPAVVDPTSRLPRDPPSMRKRRAVMEEAGHGRPDAVQSYFGRATPAVREGDGDAA